jgi:hypothetical protein
MEGQLSLETLLNNALFVVTIVICSVRETEAVEILQGARASKSK